MAAQDLPYQPGAILHAAIVGAFKTRGLSFEAWCAEHDIELTESRQWIDTEAEGTQ